MVCTIKRNDREQEINFKSKRGRNWERSKTRMSTVVSVILAMCGNDDGAINAGDR